MVMIHNTSHSLTQQYKSRTTTMQNKNNPQAHQRCRILLSTDTANNDDT
jgi:hypothetical protein